MLLGPTGKCGRVTLPLNVFVTDAKREKLVTDKVAVDVDIALEKPIGYFSLVRTVTFPFPEGSRPEKPYLTVMRPGSMWHSRAVL